MKLPLRVPLVRRLKFASVGPITLFLILSFTTVFRALAPSVNATPSIPADIPSSGDPRLDQIIFNAGEREGVDPRFIHAVIWQESKYNPTARSQAGAQGLMQLMPATAQRFGCSHPADAAENVQAGTKYLGWLLKRFDGDLQLVLAGYNAGEGAVDKYKGVPPFNETREYVRKIVSRYGKTYHPVLSPAAAIVAFHLGAQHDRQLGQEQEPAQLSETNATLAE